MAFEYIFIEIFAIAKMHTHNIPIEAIISGIFALPTNILNGIQNGADIGNIAANRFILLAGFTIEKYDK